MLKEIQNLRAIAILAVILIHVTAQFTEVKSLTLVTGIALVLDSAANFAVPLFICISGFVLAMTNYPLSTFYIKRGVAILPAYFLFSIFYSIYSHKPILESILNSTGYYHLWFFHVIVGLYLFFPVIIRLCHGEITLITSLVIQLYFWRIPHAIFLKAFPIWLHGWLSYIFYFVLGIYVCKNYEKIRKILGSFPLIGLTIPVLILWSLAAINWLNGFYNIQFMQKFSSNPFIDPILFLFIFAIVYKIALREKSQVLKRLGDFSFGIYLIHPIILNEALITSSQYNFGPTNPLFYLLIFIFTLIASFTSVLIWYKVSEKIKNHKIIEYK